MNSIADKVAHVKRAAQTRRHACHWPGCVEQVPPAMWGCRPHWYALPRAIREAIWKAYRAGQEETGRPSSDYLAAARAAQEWILNKRKVATGNTVKALSILQPWAWLIVRPDVTDPAARSALRALGHIKDVENRTWQTSYRGRFLVHAGKAYTRRAHEEDVELLRAHSGITLPAFEQLQTGGIIGSVELVACARDHHSRWACRGQYQFVLKDARPEPFRPYRGQLGFFDVADAESTPAPADLLT